MCAKNIKYLEENIGINLYDLGIGNGFLDKTKEKIDKMYFKM